MRRAMKLGVGQPPDADGDVDALLDHVDTRSVGSRASWTAGWRAMNSASIGVS